MSLASGELMLQYTRTVVAKLGFAPPFPSCSVNGEVHCFIATKGAGLYNTSMTLLIYSRRFP